MSPQRRRAEADPLAPKRSPLRRHAAAPSDRAAQRRPRRPTERSIARLAEVLERVDRAEAAYADLLSVLSHDLRNPLSVVLVGVRLLERHMAETAPERRAVDAIARGADEINRLVQDLVDARRMDEHGLHVEPAPVAAGELLERAIEALEPSAAQRSVALRQEDATGGASVAADAEAITRALRTIGGDALRFSPTGGTIVLRADVDGERVRLSVEDEGPGVDDDVRAGAFQRPLGSKARSRQGGSVSAFVARGLVEAHGGRVWIEPAARGGAAVRITLPRA